ncbi:MAG: hypothetical protein AAF358_13520 [Pseudomonadota bacterium]
MIPEIEEAILARDESLRTQPFTHIEKVDNSVDPEDLVFFAHLLDKARKDGRKAGHIAHLTSLHRLGRIMVDCPGTVNETFKLAFLKEVRDLMAGIKEAPQQTVENLALDLTQVWNELT